MGFQSSFGGGNELLVLSIASFIWCERERYFYFLVTLSLNKMIGAYFKLAYADPRPYMMTKDIFPYSCSKGFGNPSGHSSASAVFSIVLFLDYFHGNPIRSNK